MRLSSTEKTGLEGGIGIALVRREEVQVEGPRPWLRNGHDTISGQQVDCLASVSGICKGELGEKYRKVGCNHTYP